jgi:hypothetical protein
MSEMVQGDGRWGRATSVGLPLLLALLPKCPLCVATHAAVLGGLGLGGAAGAAWMRGIAAAAVVTAVALLGWRAGRRRGYLPFALGCAGAALVLAEVSHAHPVQHAPAAHSHWMLWAGIATLVAASLWNAWPRRRSAACTAAAHC